MLDKRALRREIAAQKRALSPAQIETASADLTAQLLAHPLFRAARSLYAYLSYNQEVRTLPLIRQAQALGKRVAVPKVYGETDKFFNNNVLLFEYDFGIHGDIIDDGEISSVTVEGTTANVVFKSNVPASENPNARFSMTVTAAEVPASAVEGCESFNIEVVR